MADFRGVYQATVTSQGRLLKQALPQLTYDDKMLTNGQQSTSLVITGYKIVLQPDLQAQGPSKPSRLVNDAQLY